MADRGHAFGQLRRALRHAEADPARAASWRAVLDGLADGTPTDSPHTPGWATPEVLHSGATGRYLAEAPLRWDERELVASLPADVPGTTDRERLNLYYLSDAGQAVLLEALAYENYRVDIPEHAALPTVTWLLANDHHAAALDLVAELRPLMHRLRMTPYLDQTSPPAGAVVKVASAGQVKAVLRTVTTPAAVEAMRTTLAGQPLYDRLVALWCDTVEGDLPTLHDGRVTGGWPCRVWPADWAERRSELLAATRTVRRHARGNFTRLRNALVACETDSRALTARDVGWIRRALANTVTKHGAPGSARRAALREHERAVLARPTRADMAAVVAQRLDAFPDDAGVPSVGAVVAGLPVPRSIDRKVTRALEAPVGELVSRGVITSGEALAKVLPRITASLRAANIDDPALSGLYSATYAAFRRGRRMRVRFGELPWIAAVAPLRAHRLGPAEAARQTLAQSTVLAWSAFSHALLPNPLLREFAALAGQAGLKLPLVQEIAPGRCTGTFPPGFAEAAAIANRVMAGTLYARYYDLVETWDGAIRTEWGQAVGFAELCGIRAGTTESAAVLEQAQILTTHNLAVLADGLVLRDQLTGAARRLAVRALDRAVRGMAGPFPDRPAAVVALGRAARAWRQGIFFLSYCDADTQRATVRDLRPYPVPRLRPAIDGLAAVVAGERFDDGAVLWFAGDGPVREGYRWLGSPTGRHWAID